MLWWEIRGLLAAGERGLEGGWRQWWRMWESQGEWARPSAPQRIRESVGSRSLSAKERGVNN